MTTARQQLANSAKKCENRWAKKKVRSRQPKKCERERKSAKTVENKRENRRNNVRKRLGCFLLPVFLAHLPVAVYSGGLELRLG